MVPAASRTLCQGHGEPVDFTILPALEEIDLGLEQPTYLNQNESLLASFRQFASARQRAGRPVKVSFRRP
jgi:hypothetical protein